jgi:hypothetical protein
MPKDGGTFELMTKQNSWGIMCQPHGLGCCIMSGETGAPTLRLAFHVNSLNIAALEQGYDCDPFVTTHMPVSIESTKFGGCT